MGLSDEGRARTAAVTGGLVPAAVRVGDALHCLVWGDDTPPTAVLIHGNGGHAHWWDPLVPALVPGWRLVALDLRGHGESAWTEPPRYRIADFAADVDRVVAALAPPPVVLVGHSMGGRVAAWYAAHHPDVVRALVLIDTRLVDVDPAGAAQWRASVTGKRHGRGYPTRDAALAAFRFVPDEPDVPAAVIADLAHHAVIERARGDWTFRFDRAVLTLDADGAGDLMELLRRIRCPTLVLAGADSWVMDARQRAAVVATIPHAVARVFPGGHHFLVARGREVGDALRAFVDGLPASERGR